MEFWRYWRLLRKRKWMMLLGVFICVGIVTIAVFATPKTYIARTSVMEHKADNTQVYPQPMVIQGLSEAQLRMANLANIARSYEVLRRSAETVEALGFSTNYTKLLDNADVKPREDTEIIDIDVTSPNPEEATNVANAIAAEFAKFYNELMHGPNLESRKFIESQVPLARAELERAQASLASYKSATNTPALDSQTQQIIFRQSNYMQSLAQAQVAADDSRMRLKSLERQLPTIRPVIRGATTVRENPIWQAVQTNLVAAEGDYAAMLKTRGPNHPAVIQAQKRIEELKDQAKKQSQRILSDETNTQNPVYNSILQQYMATKAEAIGNSAKVQVLKGQVAAVKPELDTVPQREMRLAQLTLDLQTKSDKYKLLQNKLEEAKIREQQDSNESAIKVIDRAYVVPIKERRALKIALALLFAPLFAGALVFLLNYLDNSLKTPAEAEALLGLPVVAVVPLVKSHSLAQQKNPKALQTFYQMLSLDLSCPGAKLLSPSVVVASAEPDVGRSTTAANLAVSLAKDGARVILVDADLRRPSQHTLFGVGNKKGLTTILDGQATLEDVVTPTQVAGLLLLPAGPVPENPVRVLRSDAMQEFIKGINEVADFVIFDTPPGITFADASIIVSYAKNVLLCHAAGRVSRGAEMRFNQRLQQVGANFLGIVLNKVRPEDSDAYFHFRRTYGRPEQRNGKHLPGSTAALPGGVEDDSTLTRN